MVKLGVLANSLVDIHFWISVDVTKNGIWAPQTRINIHTICLAWCFSPLKLSLETKHDGKVTTEEHVEWNKDGFFCFRASKCALKVRSTVVFGIPLKWNCLSLHTNFRFVWIFCFRKNYLQKLDKFVLFMQKIPLCMIV